MKFIRGGSYTVESTIPHRDLPREYEEIFEKIVLDPEFEIDVVNIASDNQEIGEILEKGTESFARDMIGLAASERNISKSLNDGFRKNLFLTNALDLNKTVMATEMAIENKENTVNPAGGHHHAHRGGSYAPQFNMLNDITAGINYAKDFRDIEDILVIDLDVHHGDGTVYDTRTDDSVFTYSIHQWDLFPKTDSGWKDYDGAGKGHDTVFNYPMPKEIAGDSYNEVVRQTLPEVNETVDPDLVFFQAGRDLHHEDYLADLKLDLDSIYERDSIVSQTVDAPIITLSGGGYGPKAVKAAVNTLYAIEGMDQRYIEDSDISTSEDKIDKIQTWYPDLEL